MKQHRLFLNHLVVRIHNTTRQREIVINDNCKKAGITWPSRRSAVASRVQNVTVKAQGLTRAASTLNAT